MNSVLGKIVFGTFELGALGAPNTTGTVVFTASPTCSVTISGGFVLRTFTSIPGVIALGKFELGQVSDVNSQAVLGKGNFRATASPILTVVGATADVLNFVATADPLLTVGVGGSFIASADPRLSLLVQAPAGFLATAAPQLSIFIVNYQQQSCLVSGPLGRSIKAKNFVY